MVLIQGSTLEIGIAVQEVAQALGHRHDPLPHRQARDDVIGRMRGCRHHAAGVARVADASGVSQSEVFVQVLSGLYSVIALAVAAVFAPRSFS